jgi:glucokinase
VNTPEGFFVGIDIGGTSVESVVTDGDHQVVARGLHPTDASSEAGILASAGRAIRQALGEPAVDRERITGIGVGVPGQVEVEGGVVRLAMNLNIGGGGFPIGPSIAEEFGLATTVENDVKAASVGAYEALSRQTPDLHALAYLSIGTGISAGFVLDGDLHRGREGMAGEIGHVVVEDDGPPCRCGLNGCLEAMAAGPAIRRLWPGGDGQHAHDLFSSAADGDPAAQRMAGAVTGRLTEAIQWLAAAIGADLVALGGGVGSVGGPLLAAIRARLAAMADRSDVARRMLPPERVVAMPSGHPTGAIGAAALARQRLSVAVGERTGTVNEGGAG